MSTARQRATPASSERSVREDRRKGYPAGTRGAVTIEAETDEPQTLRRGREFAETVGDTMVEARALVEQRLREAGFADIGVWVDMGGTDLGYWWDTQIAVDVYEMRQAQAEEAS